MRTKIYILSLLLVSLVMGSCFKDKGNYEYSPLEAITITGIEKSYVAIANIDKLTITPTVESNLPNAKFNYEWGIYETSVQGYAPVLQRICKTKDLENFSITKEAKLWKLVFKVTNTVTGYSKIIETSLNIETQFTRGWYVVKDDGTYTDIDQFLTPTVIQPLEKPLENVLSLVNGTKLNGKALKINCTVGYKALSPNGRYVNTKSLFITSEKDICAANVNSMKYIRRGIDLFYDASTLKPYGAMMGGSNCIYLVNDGKAHTIYGMSSNTGKFGLSKMIDENNSNYNLSKFSSVASDGPLMFDSLSSTFVIMTAMDKSLITPFDDPKTEFSARKNNMKCIYMGFQKSVYNPTDWSSDYYSYGVFENKTTGERSLWNIKVSETNFFVDATPIPASDKANSATLFTISKEEDVMYFVADGKVWTRNLVSGIEKEEYTLPAGETAVLLRHMFYKTYKDVDKDFHHNFIAVGTNHGGKYTVRMFAKNAGSFLSQTPDVIFSGNGNLGDLLYMSPSVRDSDAVFL